MPFLRSGLFRGFLDVKSKRNGKHTNADDVELEAALQELALNLAGDTIETDMAVGVNGGRGNSGHFRSCWWAKDERELYGRWSKLMPSGVSQDQFVVLGGWVEGIAERERWWEGKRQERTSEVEDWVDGDQDPAAANAQVLEPVNSTCERRG